MQLSSKQNDFAFRTVKVPFASYVHRWPAARDSVSELSLTTIQTQSTCSVRTDVLPNRLVITNCSAIITYIFRRMSIYVIDISVVFITFMLLFTFNLGAYSANGNDS